MIQVLQKFSQSRPAKIFLAIVALSFMVFFGGGSWFRQHDPNATIAEIGNISISRYTFAEKVQKQAQQVMAHTGKSMTREDLLATGFAQMVLSQVIQENLLDLEAEHLGLTVDDEGLKAHIQSIKAFQNDKGIFDRTLFTQLLRSNGLSEDVFIEEIRQELIREQLIGAIMVGVNLPEEMTGRLFNAQYQHRQARMLIVSPKSMPSPPSPSVEVLEAFYKAHQKEFETPELRTFTVLAIDPTTLAKEIPVTEEEIKTAYEMKGADKKPFKEIKPLLIIEIQKEKATEKAYQMTQELDDKIAGGATFEELSPQVKGAVLVKLTQVDQNGQDQMGTSSAHLPRDKELATEMLQNGFALEQNTESPFSQAKNGVFYTIRVDQITPAALHPFSEIKEQVLKVWKETEQIKAAKLKAEDYVASFNKGERKVPSMTLLPNLSLAQSSPSVSEEVKNLVFSLRPNQAGMVWTSGGFVVVVLNTIIPPTEKIRQEKMASFQETLLKQYQSDILLSYLSALRIRYPVKVNSKAMTALFSS